MTMAQDSEEYTAAPGMCSEAPWWTAPVIVTGSGGTGTRGVVQLLEALGVRMACVDEIHSDSTLPTLFDEGVCNVTCNNRQSEYDCLFLTDFGSWELSYLHANFTRAGLGGTPVCESNEQLLDQVSDAPNENMCGGTRVKMMQRMRRAVRLEYQKPLRWGMKDPHAIYYANVLRTMFPCMVMVASVRDLPTLTRTMPHVESRLAEALSLGHVNQALHDWLDDDAPHPHGKGTRFDQQKFFHEWTRLVNLNFARWAASCLADQVVHLPWMRMVAVSGAQPSCLKDALAPLVAALGLNETKALPAAAGVIKSSVAGVLESSAQAGTEPLWVTSNLSWPVSFEPSSCGDGGAAGVQARGSTSDSLDDVPTTITIPIASAA